MAKITSASQNRILILLKYDVLSSGRYVAKGTGAHPHGNKKRLAGDKALATKQSAQRAVDAGWGGVSIRISRPSSFRRPPPRKRKRFRLRGFRRVVKPQVQTERPPCLFVRIRDAPLALCRVRAERSSCNDDPALSVGTDPRLYDDVSHRSISFNHCCASLGSPGVLASWASLIAIKR